MHSTGCARAELAPLALDAYPEAYVEFKRLLLLLVYREGDLAPQAQQPASAAEPAAAAPAGAPPPVGAAAASAAAAAGTLKGELSELLSPAARRQLSETVYHTLRQATGKQRQDCGTAVRLGEGEQASAEGRQQMQQKATRLRTSGHSPI